LFDKESRECAKEYFEITLRCILLIDNDLKNKKSGQLSKKIELSTLVESGGNFNVELGGQYHWNMKGSFGLL
jgi:hypothetical protein